MAMETFKNMTLAFREKMLEASIIAGLKKARHTYPEWSTCWFTVSTCWNCTSFHSTGTNWEL